MNLQGLQDSKGNPIRLLNKVGKGGEGAVYNVDGSPSKVAKIYFQLPDLQKIDKIFTMVKIGTEQLQKLATWPLDLIFNKKGKLVGFIMNKLVGHLPIFELYSPKLRLEAFPQADWRFLIHAAMNAARAFAVIHEAGHVIGDVNHGNLFVAKNATVRFIDTDSFQVSQGDSYWSCDVGVITHQPPEMQGKSSYKGVLRTPNHDNFGLAILIFQLLCLARHPFSGRFQGVGDMPIEKAITEFRYAFSSDLRQTQMMPPLASFPMDAFTHKIRDNFERAFAKSGINGLRPTATDWISALEGLMAKLNKCDINPSHYHLSGLKSCPWCDIESKGGFLLFPLAMHANLSSLNIDELWQQVLDMEEPCLPLALPDWSTVTMPVSHEALEAQKRRAVSDQVVFTLFVCMPLLTLDVAAIVCGFLAFIICKDLISFFCVKRKFNNELGKVKTYWKDLTLRWQQASENSSFKSTRKVLEDRKAEFSALQGEYYKRLQELNAQFYQSRLSEHLKKYHITYCNAEGLGVKRIETLEMSGIESAADISEVNLEGVTGIGDVLIKRLLDWRRQCELEFRFDPRRDVSRRDMEALYQYIAIKRNKVEKEFATDFGKLQLLQKQLAKSHQILKNEVADFFRHHGQVIVDGRALAWGVHGWGIKLRALLRL